jgi:hypothetical protein
MGDKTDTTVDDSTIAVYVSAAQTAYTYLRQTYEPSYKGPGKKCERLWWDLGRTLAENMIEPGCFMRYAFEFYCQSCDNVYEQMVTSPSTVARYLAARPEREKEIELLCSLQSQEVLRRMRRGEKLEEILMDPDASLSAVFRFAVASDGGLTAVAKTFESAARRMLMFEPAYRTHLAKMLPKEP